MLYGACSKAGKAMGLDGMMTYIHDDETGVSLKAAGWVKDKVTSGGEWTRETRQRGLVEDNKPKVRWWAPWSLQLQAATENEAATHKAAE